MATITEERAQALAMLIGRMESMRGLVYLGAFVLPLLSGVLLLAIGAPRWFEVDSVKFILLAAAIGFVPTVQVACVLAARLVKFVPPNDGHPQVIVYAFGFYMFVCGAGLATITTGFTITLWVFPHWDARSVLAAWTTILVASQFAVIRKMGGYTKHRRTVAIALANLAKSTTKTP